MRIALSLFCLLFSTTKFASAQQQVPNGGFENWIYNEHYFAEVPEGAAGMNWVSGDSLMTLLCGWSQQPQVQKTTDGLEDRAAEKRTTGIIARIWQRHLFYTVAQRERNDLRQ